MTNLTNPTLSIQRVAPSAVLEVLKPITWFPPMWALLCGVVSSGFDGSVSRWPQVCVGILLAGPLVCGTSQVVNDWFDRHVDAINEPTRPIPSGRIPGRLGLHIAILWSLISLVISTFLGVWGFLAACFGLALAWAYSAPPLRLKQNGWLGNAACGACYEGLPWFTGALVMSNGLPSSKILLLAALYSLGAHGIMTLNDFKAIEGDQKLGVRSLPVQLGTDQAALLACYVMAIPQLVVVFFLTAWGHAVSAFIVGIILLCQIGVMTILVQDPRKNAPWYNATGVTLYVLGMMVAAWAIRPGDGFLS